MCTALQNWHIIRHDNMQKNKNNRKSNKTDKNLKLYKKFISVQTDC